MSNDQFFRTTALEIHILSAITTKKTMQALEQHPQLAELGVSMLQFGVLRAIHHQPHIISDLSQHMMVDPSTLVPAVDALERKGLAVRGRDPKDRRRTPISITKKGRQIAACHLHAHPFAEENNPLLIGLRVMGEEQTQALLDLLRDLVSHLPEGEKILQHVSSRVTMHFDKASAANEEEKE